MTIDPDRFIAPSLIGPDGKLTPVQVEQWRAAGYALVDGLFPDALIAEAAAAAAERFPDPGTVEADELRTFGNTAFPLAGRPAIELTLDHPLLVAVARLLECPVSGLRLTQSDLWPKYGRSEGARDRFDNHDQRIHVDYPNHTLVHPTPWSRPGAVEAIVYLSGVEDCGGPTAVVPRFGADDPAYRWPIVDSPGIGDVPWMNDREAAEAHLAEERPEMAAFRRQLYDRERYTAYRPGTVLLYRHDVWHRGTPLRSGARRFALNLTYRRADCPWLNTLNPGWAWSMYRRDQLMERLIGAATVEQRAVLGFPPPGSPYWCEETLEAVTARYEAFGFDPAPYRPAET